MKVNPEMHIQFRLNNVASEIMTALYFVNVFLLIRNKGSMNNPIQCIRYSKIVRTTLPREQLIDIKRKSQYPLNIFLTMV